MVSPALESVLELEAQLSGVRSADLPKLEAQLQRMRVRSAAGQPIDRLLSRATELATRSVRMVQERAARIPDLSYPSGLPVSQRRSEILAALESHQVVILAGETGSGKTTQLPKLCLEIGRGQRGLIGHTQPRRLAARRVAERVATELGERSDLVGFQIRFQDQTDDQTLVKLMTDGILLAETRADPDLRRYDTLIIDEAHERSLNIDFLLGYLKQLVRRRPDLKLVITSATIDVETFSRHFDGAPVVEVSGRTYPVEVRYRPPVDGDDPPDLQAAVLDCLREIDREPSAQGDARDVLVFLSSEREIREVAEHLRRAQLAHTEVLPLYARLSYGDQRRVFAPHQGRRIVLATNVAETSITVPGIRYVIDPGFARISRYSYRSKIQRLPIEPVSQASADQRKGRCGRVGPGVCFRLYSEEDFLSRARFTEPEIQRTNLAAVILQMLRLNLGEIERFPFVDPPDPRFVRDGFRLLVELGAVDGRHRLTQVGRQLTELPVDPRIGRMLVAAAELNCLKEMLIIASALSCQDPRERPVDKQQAADERHRHYADRNSDFAGFVQLWGTLEAEREALSQSQYRTWCQRNYLSWVRVREWRETHRQLHLLMREAGHRENAEPADSAVLHRAILAGLLSHIGLHHEGQEYQAPRSRKFAIFPGSGLRGRRPKWVMAMELVETSRLFGRTVAGIDPAWIEPMARHLTKRHWFEPRWDRKRGQVVASEQVTLYGLPIVARRRVNYGPLDPPVAREIFIREALVAGAYDTPGEFLAHNRALVEEIEALEEKHRTRDLLVSDQMVFDFYTERLPDDAFDRRSFEAWRSKAERTRPDLLRLDLELLLKAKASDATGEQFPDALIHEGAAYPLQYRFSPGAVDDGVTLRIPLAVYRQISEARYGWLVPGMLRDKCIALLKALPKELRKQLVPIPDVVDQVLVSVPHGAGSLTAALRRAVADRTGVDIEESVLSEHAIDDIYRMRLEVTDDRGHCIGAGRDPVALRRQLDTDFPPEAPVPSNEKEVPWSSSGYTDWAFDGMPDSIEVQRGGVPVRLYPAIVPADEGVGVELFSTPGRAAREGIAGVVHLVKLRAARKVRDLRRSLRTDQQTLLLFARLAPDVDLVDQIVGRAVRGLVEDAGPLPRSSSEFEHRLAQVNRGVFARAQESLELVSAICAAHHRLRLRLDKPVPAPLQPSHADVCRQLERLLVPDFVEHTPDVWLAEFPRYLAAALYRLEHLQGNLTRDQSSTDLLERLWQNYDRLSRSDAVLDEAALLDYRWRLEELRVSLFAQRLGTRVPVSEARLAKQWAGLVRGTG